MVGGQNGLNGRSVTMKWVVDTANVAGDYAMTQNHAMVDDTAPELMLGSQTAQVSSNLFALCLSYGVKHSGDSVWKFPSHVVVLIILRRIAGFT